MRWGLLLLAASALWAQSPQVIAIRNARIHPVSAPVIEQGTVVIRHGLIAGVGASVVAPPDAWVLEGAGLDVYPGLIDGLSTIGIPEPPSQPRGGPAAMPGAAPQAPPARGPEDRPMTNSWMRAADLVRNNEARIEAARGKGFTSAVTFPSGGIFTGQGAVINLAGERSGTMVVESRVGQQITMARGGFNVFPGSLMGTIAYIRQVYLDADHYAKTKEMYAKNPSGLERPAYDRALEGVLESPRVLLPAVSVVEIRRMVRFARELNRPAILYGLHEAYAAPEFVKQSGFPALVNVNWPSPPRDRDPEDVDSLRVLELRENAPATPAALAKAGVKFAFYQGGAENPHRAVREAIAKGLDEAEALRAFTLTPAEIFGVADRLGSIEKGKIANLVVAKGGLFVERPQIQFVFVDGERFEPPPSAAPAKPEATQ
jgi:hypothetical protein